MKKLNICFCILGLLLCRGSMALTIETYGDSLTHGIMARTSIEKGTPEKISAILEDMSRFGITKDLTYVEKHGNKSDAWPSYLKDKLESKGSGNITLLNHAMLGAKAIGLVKQVKKIEYSSQGGMAFFFIGHNDICPSLDKEISELTKKFRNEYQKGLTTWDKLHEGATAYILPVANVDEAFNVLNHYVWFEDPNGKEYRCNDQWGLFFPYCRKLGALASEGTIKEVVRPRIEAMNAELEELVDAMNKSPTKNKYFFLRDLSKVEYHVPYFAVDCFHMSAAGQKLVAKSVEPLLE